MSRRSSPPPLSVATRGELQVMSVPALRLILNRYHLVQTGPKSAIVSRLWAHLSANSLLRESSNESGDQSGSSDVEDDDQSSSAHDDDNDDSGSSVDSSSAPARRRHTSPRSRSADPTLSSPSSSGNSTSAPVRRRHTTHKHRRVAPSVSHSAQLPPRRSRDRSRHRRHHRRHSHSRDRRHHHHSRSSSSSSSSSASSSSRSRSRSHRHHRRRRGRGKSPQGLPVKDSLRRKIRRGEFVQFNKLLASSQVRTGVMPKSKRATLSPIAGLDSWLEAWSIYASVVCAYTPNVAPQLFKYQAFISRCSAKFLPHAWLQYDQQFRMKLASDPKLSWSVADPELIASWLSAEATKPKRACFTCGSPDHFSTDCPSRATASTPQLRCPVCNTIGHVARQCPSLTPTHKTFRPSSDLSRPPPVTGLKPPAEICDMFNRRFGSCFRGSKCKFRHVCYTCGGPHPQRLCTQQGR